MEKIVNFRINKAARNLTSQPWIVHAVLVTHQAGNSGWLETFSLMVVVLNIGLQTASRLSSDPNDSPLVDVLITSPYIANFFLVIVFFPAAFLIVSFIVPSVAKKQRLCVETQSSYGGMDIYLLANTANFLLCTPVTLGILLSLSFTHMFQLEAPPDSAKTTVYALYGFTFAFAILLFMYFTSMYLGISRPKDFFSCTSKTLRFVQTVTLALTLVNQKLRRNFDGSQDGPRICFTLLTIAQLLWVLPNLILGITRASFHSPKYRLVTLLGMIFSLYDLSLDVIFLIGGRIMSSSLKVTTTFTIFVLSSWFLTNKKSGLELDDSQMSANFLSHVSELEASLWSQSKGATISAEQAIVGLVAEGLKKQKGVVNQRLHHKETSAEPNHHQRATLLAEYIFSLYNTRYSQSKQQVLDIDFAFSFAHFLLKWKKHVYLLTSLHRSLTAATLSLRHAASLAVLEAAVTRQLQTQDAEFSYFFSETTAEQPTDRSKPTPNRRTNVSLDVYNIIETVSAFERLVDQMRIQLRLQTQFLSAVESRSQPVADVHSAVRVITEQRAHCKVLFDDLHAKADSAQTFHLLPFAFFLEHTENNLERRVELVKTYYFKSQVRRVHRRMFNELVDQSLTIVTESERAKLGTIRHSSKNVGLVFGADIPPLEGRSLDLFFHSEMATAHRRQMRDYMQHFDRPYLGEHRDRYVTVGNGVYYRVNCVTKFVPHLKHGFQFVTMMKHLTDETGKYGKMDTISIHLALNDKLNVVGIGYNHTLVKSGLLERPKPKSNLHEDTEPMSPSRKPVQRHSIMDLIGKPLSYLSPEIEQVVGDRFAEIHNLQAETAIQIQNNQYQKLKNGMQLIVPESAVLDDNPKPEEFNVPPAETPEKHKEEDDLVLESGDFMGRYDKTLNLGLNYRAPSCSDSETQSMIQEIAIDHSKHKRMALLLNFTHYCWKGFWAPEVDDVYSMMMGSFSKQTILSHSETVEKRSTTMKTTHINGNLGNGSVVPVHSGLTILRFRSPTLSDMHSFNLIQKARSSVIDSQIAADELVEFDPVSLLRNFIGKDLEIKQVNLKPDPGDQTRRKSAVFDAQDFSPAQKASRHHKPGSSFGSYLEDLPGASKDSPHGLQHAGQSQTNTALLTSRNVLSPLTNGSGGLIPQSKRATLKDYPGGN